MSRNWYLYILPMLMLLPVFVFRDFTTDNELRYISIIEEALRDGSLFAFHNHGVAYADKPPLYFWFAMLFRLIAGDNYIWLLGALTVVPAIVIMRVMNRWCFGTEEYATRVAPPMLALLTCVMFLGGTVVLRMDMMMTMFIVLALHSFWKLYTGTGRARERFLLPLWIFLAVFSKGAVGILMPVVVMASFLATEGKIKSIGRYMGWRFWGVIVLFAAAWFAAVYAEGGAEYLDNLLFKQTVGRGVNSFHHKEPVWYYLKTIWYSAAPWSLFVAVMFVAAFRKRLLREEPLMRFLAVTVLSTFVVMSLVSSKIDIYLLPIYPFFVYFAFMAHERVAPKAAVVAVTIPAVALACVFPALFFCEDMLPVVPQDVWLLYFGAGVLMLFAVAGVVAAIKGHVRASVASVASGMLMCVLVVSFTVPDFNPYIGVRALAAKGVEVAEYNNVSRYAYYKFRGDNMDVFVGRQLIGIEEFDELVRLKESGVPVVLFVRGRELRREEALGQLLEEALVGSEGDYKIYLLGAR